jgi:hypothetical protein
VKADRPWPLLAVGASLQLVGAGTAWAKIADALLSTALAAAGLVCLGVWLATEVADWTLRRVWRDDDEG